MSRKPAVAAAAALPIAEAMRSSQALTRLTDRLRESNAMYAVIVPLLPAGLAASVRPGPLDEAGWSLLAANAAVAAKLRHLAPRFEERLRERGHATAAVRIKVQPL
ncbi:MAG TPA: hypothetical protein VNS61_05050 [Caldimonas sp.]|nr:hypothetical protein [Caldimonas sp.]